MGSVLVEAMGQEGMRELGVKKVHPFFSKEPAVDPARHSELSAQPPTAPDHDDQHDSAQSGSDSPNGRRKRRKPDSSVTQDAPGSKRPRRKRQGEGRQTTLVPTEQASDITPEPNTTDIPTPPLSDAPMTFAEAPSQSALEAPPVSTSNPPDAANKKVLKWNPKTGTLGSPPKSKSKTLPSRIVCVKYGRDEASRKDMGDKITQILDGKTLFPPTTSKSRAKKAKESVVKKAPGPAKATHPFFTGKAKQTPPTTGENHKTAENRPSRQTIFTSTPLSPKKTRNPFTSDHQVPRFGIRTGTTKIPGAVYPLWPAKGMAHIRGLEGSACSQAASQDNVAKKSKGYTVTVSSDESVLGGFCTSMDLTALRNSLPTNDDNFEPAPTELRIPTRHFESGRKAQKRIRSELRTLRPTPTEDDDDIIGHRAPSAQLKRTHPAILRLYEELESSLSAYDKSACECLSWAHKYAPSTAAEVLQAGREAILLKEWLQTLKVQSVGTGNADAGGAKGKAKSSTAPKKKRKKDKLDGFIIDSEEEANEMDEVSEDDDDWAPAGSGLTKKTVIRSGDAAAKGGKDQGRLTNAVVISGPHGSGKTAAVYAVAKELGFEIFEINPGSRRSGKDILEKVGDMTRNHLVQQHRADPITEAEEDEVARDLKSGKQGMMTAFFQPKVAAASKKPTKKPTEAKSNETTKGSQGQKQSLILLEEVDVLYEEDKQFWATLMGMMVQSKRPFIMTCNDENMVPLQTLNLHGIFRFSHPPTDLAIDHCLLVAANEGHLLKRSAVEALYKSRNNDLRAALVELNYWCQISVGDRKGGFDWFYLRWPKGSDRDENGDVVRVLSEDTYRKGMGWIGRDLTATCLDPLESEEEVMKQCWNSWTLDMGDWNNSLHLQSWADDITRNASEPSQRLDALTAFDEFCTSMSDADLISSGSLGTRFQEVLDPELPEIPTKTRDDFIVGRRLLEADSKSTPSTPSIGLSISLKSLTRQRLFKLSPTTDVTSPSVLQPLAEDRAVSVLDESFENCTTPMTRMDLALAFDPIAVNEKAAASSHLDPSVFDRTMKLIVLDIAPWVRGIVEFDNKLMQERLKLSNLMSEGGKRKRMRTTRSAYSALEGGERRTTRRERYFGDCLNTAFVRRTAGDAWQEVVEAMRPKESVESAPSSPSSPGSSLA
ncbi:ATPase-AAA-core domain-containing protein [Fusarium keratoplasticum]|uniref:ATPase-AAA-core domain-containing protein n=1 Tax=Fusarium keratoplasticum TaxID=1328300 RepID=A0ACC0QTR8_9HYPO|nr:ATPase-AAA-core domain-containing protein [Fusarium keratoplasticum]KAI8666448.1 ATPase-AAA-core domain-containing protein [Fusarium keratoplasticum]